MPSRKRTQVDRQNPGTISQKIYLIATPIPSIMRKGKKITPKAKYPCFSPDRISKEKPKSPAKTVMIVIPKITSVSLRQMTRTMRMMKRITRKNLRGNLKMVARVSPHR